MWSQIFMIWPILMAVPAYGTGSSIQAQRIKQPEPFDAPALQELYLDSPDSEDDLNSDQPPLDNYIKLRQKNADMSMQIEQLVAEAHELNHKLKVSKTQTKTVLAKIMKKCPRSHHRSAHVAHHEEVKMPWSLTHTATTHKQKRSSWFPGEETIRGLFDHIKSLSSGIPMERVPRSYASAGTAGQLHRDVVGLTEALKQTHVRLGQGEEVKSHLEAHLQAVQEKVLAMEEEAAKDEQNLKSFAAEEQSLDQQLAAYRNVKPSDDSDSLNEGQAASSQAEREAKVKEEVEKLHNEADRRMQESDKEVNRLKAENEKIQEAIEASQTRQQTEQSKLLNLKDSILQGNNTAAKLQQEESKLEKAEAYVKQKEVDEDNALTAAAAHDERCVEWTGKLEAKLKRVLLAKKDDATLCHDSILGLHKERMSLKDGNAKMHAELKNLKRHSEEMQRKGDETLATLNSCLGL